MKFCVPHIGQKVKLTAPWRVQVLPIYANRNVLPLIDSNYYESFSALEKSYNELRWKTDYGERQTNKPYQDIITKLIDTS